MNPLRPVLDLEPAAIRCPYPHYAALRARSAVTYDEKLDIYIVGRHADIVQINSQAGRFSNRNPMGPAIAEAMTRLGRVLASQPAEFQERAMTVLRRGDVLFTADPPEHSRHRRILNKALTPAGVSRIEPQIARHCHVLIDRFDVSRPVDLVANYANPAPIFALATLLGVRPERTGDFHDWAAAINATIGTAIDDDALLHAIEKQLQFWAFFENELRNRHDPLAQDLLSRVAHARSDDDAPLTLKEMVGFCSQLVGAGADTTTKLLTAAVRMLCEDPVLFASIRAQPQSIAAFLEEVLRLEPPVQGMFRVATAAFQLDGVSIPAGALIWCLYASGNRDTAVFANPDGCIIGRENIRQHLSFGYGPHICIGATLARSVARIALDALLARCTHIELASPEQPPPFERSYVMHGMTLLPLTLRKRQA